MESRWLPLTAMVLLVGGCASDTAPPSPVGGPPGVSRAADLGSTSGEKNPHSPKVDDFGLPLEIVLDVPEVPKEIEGPSPPIQPEPNGAGKP